MTTDELATAVGSEAGNELPSALGKIKNCLSQLTDEQVWWRSRPSFNSMTVTSTPAMALTLALLDFSAACARNATHGQLHLSLVGNL